MCKNVPRPLASLLRQFGIVCAREGLHVSVEGAGGDGRADGREELVDDVVVVDLQQDPAEHFFGGEEVLQESAVVVGAGVAGAVLLQRAEVGGVRGRPEVDAEG